MAQRIVSRRLRRTGRVPHTGRQHGKAQPDYWQPATGYWQLFFMTYDISIDGKQYRLDLKRIEGNWSCRLDGREVEVDAVLARPDVLSLRLGNRAYEVKCERVA